MKNLDIDKRAVHGKPCAFSHGSSIFKRLNTVLFKNSSRLLNLYGVRLVDTVEVNALDARSVVRTNRRIAEVFTSIGLPEICYSVVASVSIYVVNVPVRPLSILIEPRKSVRSVKPAINPNNHVPGRLQSAAYGPYA